MLPLTRNRKYRISNRLAAVAALLLVVTSLVTPGDSDRAAGSHSARHAELLAAEETPALMSSDETVKAKSNKGFRMSLFLFRNY
jgi:hypothetical protein